VRPRDSDGAFVGRSVSRSEDARLLSGRGRFADDIALPRMGHAAFVRSEVTHGRLLAVDVAAARAAPGVKAVLTGAELAEHTEPIVIEYAPVNVKMPPFPVLCVDKVRLVGDPIAIVIADSRAAAEDAADLVRVIVEPLEPVMTHDDALDPTRPPLFDELGSNVFAPAAFEHGDLDACFDAADRVVGAELRVSRLANVPMETRGIVADYDAGTDELTIHAAVQSPHLVRSLLAAATRHPLGLVRVLVGDIGGSFGLKATLTREEIAVTAASKLLGMPVKWIEDRHENLLVSGHGRDDAFQVEAAVRDDGTILGIRAELTVDQGAYPAVPLSAGVFAIGMRILMPGPYRMTALSFKQRVIATNKPQYVAYRGPWATETFIRETLVDMVAAELGLDPVDVRRRNIVDLHEQPVQMATGPTHASMTARETLERAVERIGYEAFRSRQAEARAEGRRLGIGFSTFVEPAPGPLDYRTALGVHFSAERAEARIEPDGRLTILTAQSPHGQGHHTTLAQVAADSLGVDFGEVRVISGDTRVTPFSTLGTGGSRSATMASGAVQNAVHAVKEKVLEIGAHMLEADPRDLDIVAGAIVVAGVPGRSLPLADVARLAYFAPRELPEGMSPGISAARDFKQTESGWAVATHCCTVEVDIDTGRVRILRYVVAEDCGELINPAIVDGQVRGGTVQGIAQVLLEGASFAPDGTPLTTSLADYLLPTSMDVPEIEIIHLETPPIGPVNFRGVGEGGAICAPPAVANAISDALAPHGGRVTELPVTPERVLRLAGVLTPTPGER
jgi:carbon-monoxide dehydrogenase large subunit